MMTEAVGVNEEKLKSAQEKKGNATEANTKSENRHFVKEIGTT